VILLEWLAKLDHVFSPGSYFGRQLADRLTCESTYCTYSTYFGDVALLLSIVNLHTWRCKPDASFYSNGSGLVPASDRINRSDEPPSPLHGAWSPMCWEKCPAPFDH
jgi:hypothetical protein